jgi:uncharacterized protein (TIGR03000 family)
MKKLLVCVAACAALVLGTDPLRAGDRPDESGQPAVKTTPTPKGREYKVHVSLPTPGTKLFFDGKLIDGTGTSRTYKSPALEGGNRYTYKVVAVWVENGRQVSHETNVEFKAGEDVAIDFRR